MKKTSNKPTRKLPHDIQQILFFGGCILLWMVAMILTAFLNRSNGEVLRALLTILLVLGIIYTIIYLFVMNRIYTFRRTSVIMVLEYVDHAIRMQMPLPVLLKAAGRTETGWLGRTLFGMGEKLEEGESFEECFKDETGMIPPRITTLVATTERIGRFDTVLPWMIRMERQRLLYAKNTKPASGYFVALLGFTLLVYTFLSYFILPKFDKILDDFNVQTPLAMRIQLHISAWLTGNAYPTQIIPGFFVLVALGFVYLLFRLPTGRRIAQHFFYRTPMANWLVEKRQLRDVCFMLAQGLQAGQPAPIVIRETCELELTQRLRQKLWKWALYIEEGQDISQAASKARLPSLIVVLLSGIEVKVDGAKTFDFLANYYGARFSKVMVLIQSCLSPLLLLFLGFLATVFALSVFQPLVQVIWAVMPYQGGF